jgi:hypothetical protein
MHVQIDFRPSHHMTHSLELSSTSQCSISQRSIGNSTKFDVLGSRTLQLDDGCINNVLLVPNIYGNLLFIYYIYHFGDGKK